MTRSRGQSFAIDLALALVGLTFLVLLTSTLASQIEQSVTVRENTAELQTAGETAMDALLYTPGSPANWTGLNCSQTAAIGLQKRRGEIDAAKLSRLAAYLSTDPACLGNRLGLERPNYNYTIGAFASNGTLLAGSNATSPPLTETTVVERNVVLNGSVIRLQLAVWITS